MEKKWTPEEICECIRIRKAGGGEKWVLRLVKRGYNYDMADVSAGCCGFGERVVASFDTKESALRYFLDNKLHKKVYRELEEFAKNRGALDYDDEEEHSVGELRGFCCDGGGKWADFYYVLSCVDSADAKEDDAEAIKASGVDFFKAETDEDFSHDRLWSDRTRNW